MDIRESLDIEVPPAERALYDEITQVLKSVSNRGTAGIIVKMAG